MIFNETFRLVNISLQWVNSTLTEVVDEDMQTKIGNIALYAFGILAALALTRLNNRRPHKEVKPEPPEIKPTYVARTPKEAKYYLGAHRSDPMFSPTTHGLGDSSEDLHFMRCNPGTTRVFHAIAKPMFCESTMAQHRGIIQREVDLAMARFASQALQSEHTLHEEIAQYTFHVFMELFFGTRGSYAEFNLEHGDSIRGNDEDSLHGIGEYLLDQATDKSAGVKASFRSHRLTKKQQYCFVAVLLAVAFDQVLTQSMWAVKHLSENPDIQRRTFVALTREAPTGEFPEEVVKVILESLRMHPTPPRRDHLHLHEFDQDPEYVGPNPKDFNPQRLNAHIRVPSAWTGLVWGPFGHGPHICPAWRFYKELSIPLIASLIQRYEWRSTKGEGYTQLRFSPKAKCS